MGPNSKKTIFSRYWWVGIIIILFAAAGFINTARGQEILINYFKGSLNSAVSPTVTPTTNPSPKITTFGTPSATPTVTVPTPSNWGEKATFQPRDWQPNPDLSNTL